MGPNKRFVKGEFDAGVCACDDGFPNVSGRGISGGTGKYALLALRNGRTFNGGKFLDGRPLPGPVEAGLKFCSLFIAMSAFI